MADNDGIDFGNLSQRELIILVYTKLEKLDKASAEQEAKLNATNIELAGIKTKMQVWSAVVVFCTGLAASIVVLIITKVFDK